MPLKNHCILFLIALSGICLNNFIQASNPPRDTIIELSVLGHNVKIINSDTSNEQTIGYIQNYSDSLITPSNVTAYFTNSLNSTGWSILEITSTQQSNISSSRNYHLNRTQEGIQLGILEGALTADLIDSAYNNYFNSVLEGKEITPTQQEFVNNQTAWMRKQIRLNQHDRYWQMVGFMLGQLQGMYAGYVARRMRRQSSFNESAGTTDIPILTYEHFYYLTNMGDLEDIQNAFTQTNKTEMNCDAYVKITQDDLICAHNTFNIYSLMLRVYKIYNVIIPQVDLHKPSIQAFSSRPGDLESKDDFYILNSGLVVMETSLNNYNKSNYDYLHYDSVPCWMRVNIANRLASTANEWATIFELHRSGTHNNQWLIVDYNAWRNKQTTQDPIILMVEESFSLYKISDFTETLMSTGYVASYNVPYNQDIYNQTMYQSGYGYNYTDDPRAVLFRDLSPYVNDTATVMQLIRSNNNITGDVSNAISPRYDLLSSGAYTFGGIDGKVVNSELLSLGQSLMISGPSTDGLPVFDWTNWQDVPHESMPNRYDFDWIVYQPQNNHSYSTVEKQYHQELIIFDMSSPETQSK